MVEQANVKDELVATFAFLGEKLSAPRERRLFAEAPYENFRTVFDYAVKTLGFVQLCTITGFDDGETLAVTYHLARNDGLVLNLKTRVPKATPVIRSICDAFPGCISYERELMDLLGFEVQGVPPGNRYPLPDDWPAGQYPLRKDWKTPGAEPVVDVEESHA